MGCFASKNTDNTETKMDLEFDLHSLFVSNEMEEFSHLPNMPGSKYRYPYDFKGPIYTFKIENLLLFNRVRREFVRRVDQKMQRQYHQVEKIKSLRVDFSLGSEHNDMIDQWVGCAIAKGAERIELLFPTLDYGMPSHLVDPYRFPHTLKSEFLNHLHLRNCHLLPHAEFSGFKHLKTLVLEELRVEEPLLSSLFSKCCFHLEDLTFKRCRFNRAVNMISSTLRHLKLIRCSLLPCSIDIVTPNLSSFEYFGHTLLIFKSINAPQLAKFFFSPSSYLDKVHVSHAFALMASFPSLQNLSMFLDTPMVEKLPTTIGPFQHLKEMELLFHGPFDENDDYLWVLNMLMACPRLQKLYFGIFWPLLSAKQRQRREHPGFFHKELKHVELLGCVGHTTEIELAIHFLKNVKSLEHITFGPRARAYIGAGNWFDDFPGGTDGWVKNGRNLVREQLQAYVNGRTKLIFL